MTGLGDGSEAKFLEAIKALPFMDTVRLFLSIILYIMEKALYKLNTLHYITLHQV